MNSRAKQISELSIEEATKLIFNEATLLQDNIYQFPDKSLLKLEDNRIIELELLQE